MIILIQWLILFSNKVLILRMNHQHITTEVHIICMYLRYMLLCIGLEFNKLFEYLLYYVYSLVYEIWGVFAVCESNICLARMGDGHRQGYRVCVCLKSVMWPRTKEHWVRHSVRLHGHFQIDRPGLHNIWGMSFFKVCVNRMSVQCYF